MRVSRFLLSTVRETPAEAETVSHRLMLRAGMIRKLAAGIYTWLPLGLRVLRKVEQIVREEMNRAGAQEVLMPAVQPAELWQESGRWDQYGPEARAILEGLLEKYAAHGTTQFVIPDVLEVPPISEHGNVMEISEKFGGEEELAAAVARLQTLLYLDFAV